MRVGEVADQIQADAGALDALALAITLHHLEAVKYLVAVPLGDTQSLVGDLKADGITLVNSIDDEVFTSEKWAGIQDILSRTGELREKVVGVTYDKLG